jgi:hypothetical protein
MRTWADKTGISIVLATHSPVVIDQFKETPDHLFVIDPRAATASLRRRCRLRGCCTPGLRRRPYVETQGGRDALRALDWGAVLAPPPHVRFVRSLIHDIADALGEHAVAERFAGETHGATWPPRRDNLLRNV